LVQRNEVPGEACALEEEVEDRIRTAVGTAVGATRLQRVVRVPPTLLIPEILPTPTASASTPVHPPIHAQK
jgi:hypothetical protein